MSVCLCPCVNVQWELGVSLVGVGGGGVEVEVRCVCMHPCVNDDVKLESRANLCPRAFLQPPYADRTIYSELAN